MSKRICLFAMLFVMMCSLTGCGKKPEAVVKNYFECMKAADREGMRENVKQTETSETEGVNDMVVDVLQLYAEEYNKEMSYTISDVTVEGDMATVTVKVKYSNLGPIVKLALSDLVENSISSAFNGVELDDDDMQTLFASYMEKHKTDMSILPKEDEIMVECKKVEDSWLIMQTDELINIYFCNMFQPAKDFANSDEETTEADEQNDTPKVEQEEERGAEQEEERGAEQEQISLPLTYGTYAMDNGVDAVCTAEVGFTTDEEAYDYISISAMGYGGHELTAFDGNLSINQDGNYEAYCEYLNTTILIVFDETGMNIEILSCDDGTVMESIAGKYLLTSELNLNEVG